MTAPDIAPNARLTMILEDLAQVPRPNLPPGYYLKCYAPGDERAWARIHARADALTTPGPGFYREKFGHDEALLARRQVFVLDSAGEPVATITAWEGDFEGQRIGRIHWLAVVPQHRGKGLGQALTGIACGKLIEEGFHRAYLVTGLARPAAIRLYLKLGFLPVLRDAGDRRLWAQALAAAGVKSEGI